MKSLALTIIKGGTGKSTLSMAVAGELSVYYGRTVLIDADPTTYATRTLCEEPEIELADLLFDIMDGKTPKVTEALKETKLPNLFIIGSKPKDSRLRDYTTYRAGTNPYPYKILIDILKNLNFDYCVIDCGPGSNSVKLSALLATDEIITPVESSAFCIDSLMSFSEELVELKEKTHTDSPIYRRIVVNNYDRQSEPETSCFEIIKKLVEGFDIYIIPSDEIFYEILNKKTLFQLLPGAKPETKAEISRLTKDIAKFSLEKNLIRNYKTINNLD